MKKKYLVISLVLVFGFGIGICVDKLLFTNNDISNGFNDLSQVKHEHMLSMMLETENGSGQYFLESRSTWPTKEDGYVFNSTLSKCEKGSQLRWDDENNAVVMVGNTSDKCYVYFDVYKELIKFYLLGTEYTAEDGMTWGEWIDSEYNTAGCYALSGFPKTSGGKYISDFSGMATVVLSNIIISSHSYYGSSIPEAS